MAAAVLLLDGAFMTGLASVAGMCRARRMDREMREQERAGDAGFTVSFTGMQIYIVLVTGLLLLAVSVMIPVWGFFPALDPASDGPSSHMTIPLGMMVLAGTLGFLMMLWWRTGMRPSIRGDEITLMRWHRVHRLDVSDPVSAQVVHGRRQSSGVEGLKPGFRYPGSPRVHHMTLWGWSPITVGCAYGWPATTTFPTTSNHRPSFFCRIGLVEYLRGGRSSSVWGSGVRCVMVSGSAPCSPAWIVMGCW